MSAMPLPVQAFGLLVFAPFAMLCTQQPFKLDCLWAAPCLVAAVYFTFRA